MKTLHIAPGDSAGGSLAAAIRGAGRDDEVLRFLDDLSCGPIDRDELSARAAWWGRWSYEPSEAKFVEFWERVATTEDRLVVWFGRHSASELAFFLGWADRIGERPYHVVDVTGRQLPFTKRDGSTALSWPAQSVSTLPPDSLRSLLGLDCPITAQDRDESRQTWQRLRGENAPFRVVTGTGLVSAPVDHFDPLLLAQTTPGWQRATLVVGKTMGHNSDPYLQIGDVMLRARVAALVEEGRLLADGDPRDLFCRIRLTPDGKQQREAAKPGA